MIRVAAVCAALAACGGAPVAAEAPRPCPTGPIVLSGQADVDRIASCAELPGVAIKTGARLDLSGLAVRTITGDLVIGPTVGLDTIALPRLELVTGRVRIAGNGSVTGVFLPALRVAASIAIEGNVDLRNLSMPVLAGLIGDLVIARTPSLEVIDAGSIQAIEGRLSIVDALVLAVFVAPTLRRIGALELTRTGLDEGRIRELTETEGAP